MSALIIIYGEVTAVQIELINHVYIILNYFNKLLFVLAVVSLVAVSAVAKKHEKELMYTFKTLGSVICF